MNYNEDILHLLELYLIVFNSMYVPIEYNPKKLRKRLIILDREHNFLE